MNITENNCRNNVLENKYELLKNIGEIKIYKYSNIKRKSPYKLIFQYFFDKFDSNDYKNAKILLFIINEPVKEKGQSEYQTDGLHLYYIKDKNNNPIIFIDSQGFGDTRGKIYDELIKEIFEYTFINLISHINLICFIAKSTNPRIDPLTKYILSFATSLFSNECFNNFIIISTFANKDTIKNGSLYIDSIKHDNFFKEIVEKMNKKWWYSVDSVSLLDDEIKDKLCIYTVKQIDYLYEEKIKNSISIDIKKSSEIIKTRKEFKDKIWKIVSNYKNINSKNQKINEINEKIKEYQKDLNIIINKI